MTTDPSARPNSARLPLELVNRIDRICDRFDGEWRAGGSPRIESYLAEQEEAARAVLFRELLAAEIERRLRLGEQPSRREYLERFTEYSLSVDEILAELGLSAEGARRFGKDSPALTFHDDPVSASRTIGGKRRGTVAAQPVVAGYELLGELGRGGMGVVYQAREIRLNRIVALKMILAGAHASPEAALRFLNEAEVVARLRHPNIVQVFAMGDHEGRPFVELEYVDGGNLARSIDGTPRPAQEAAALLEVLARTVHEAHRHGVIHRDLKPSNILLTADGQPKVADFGLAKAIDSDFGLTRSDLILGTPSYMAPEQAEGHSRSVGVAADVYALGAIFYELLTGRPPFRAVTALATLELVCTVEAVPPSRFQPDLPRDAETICLKCLEKDPAKRFPTAEALADDLRRYLGGHPITARPVGPAGRLWRWCLREPKVAVLLLSLGVTFVSCFAVVAWALHRAQAEAVLARVQENSALKAQARSEANFKKAHEVVERLSLIGERVAGRPELEKTRRSILETVIEFHVGFLKEKSDDPATLEETAMAYRRVAHLRYELGQREQSALAYRRAGELYDRLLARDPANPHYRMERAWVDFWVGLFQARREYKFAEAQDSYERSIAITKRLLAQSPRNLAYRSALALFLTNWAGMRLLAGAPIEAENALKRVIELQRAILADSPGNAMACRDLLLALEEYSGILLRSSRRDEAESASREAVSLLQGLVARQTGLSYLHAYLYRYQNSLASLLQVTGCSAEAEVWRRQAYVGLKSLSASFPDVVDYRLSLAKTAMGLGSLIDSAGRHDEARALYRSALALHKKLAADFPENASYLNDYARALVTVPDDSFRDPPQAVRLATRATSLAPTDADNWNTLGVAHYRAGDPAAARLALEKSVERRKDGSFHNDWLVLAMACWKIGDKPQARAWYDKVVGAVKSEQPINDETRRFQAEAESLLTKTGP